MSGVSRAAISGRLLFDLSPLCLGSQWWYILCCETQINAFTAQYLPASSSCHSKQEDTCSSSLKLVGWGCVCVRGVGMSWSVQVGNLSSVVHPHSQSSPLSHCVGLCVGSHCEGLGPATVVSGTSLLRQRARLRASTLPKQQTDWLTDWVSDWLLD